MLLQVCMNLIYNAITHNVKEKGILLIDWIENVNVIEYSFSDNGLVIPKE